jgi:radical SAM superfamily enzyme YgiQ (UPF0313 family)
MVYEYNTITKNPLKVNIRFASCYPNIYRTAMSSLGYQIIYGMVNDREDSWCERVIYPNNRSIESNSPLKDFDIISFSLQYEQDYFNALKMLKSSGIPLQKESRNDKYPFIIAGGPCASSNPMPISEFVDAFIIGEGEAILNKFLDLFQSLKNPKKEIESFLDIKGVYIPDNHVENVLVSNMNDAYHITSPIVVKTDNKQYSPVFNNSILLNVSRGCVRGCRFCMSGYMYRPIRETPVKILIDVAKKARENTGLNKVSLIGSAVSDYSKINKLTKKLLDENFQISTPSLRIESINIETLENLSESGLRTITIAPESIYSLRKSLNKDISDEMITEVIEDALSFNFNIKLYFLIGILNETKEDVKELSYYINFIDSLKYKKIDRLNKKHESHIKKNKIKFSVNPLIPKPHTPFQWEGYDRNDIKNKIRYLKHNLKNMDIKFDSPKMGLIQYVLSCKGSEIGKLIEKSIPSLINQKSEGENNLSIDINQWKKYCQGYDIEEDLPWKNINIGVSESFLKKERERILNLKNIR